MGLFGYIKKNTSKITQESFTKHHLYAKIRHVFPYGLRGERKVKAVDVALDIDRGTYHQTPRLKHPLEEEDAEEKLNRLAHAGTISRQEAEKVRDILDEDLHPR